MNTKNRVYVFFALFVGFVIGYFLPYQNGSNDTFSKKQECAEYIPEIEEEFENWQSLITEGHQLEEVFYSPNRNTCLKAYSLIGGITERVIVYAIDDIFTGENIWQKSTGEVTDLEAFQNEINRLKN